MKIAFTGGGTGGHFYPLIAVAEKIKSELTREKILDCELYFIADKEYDKGALFENNMKFVPITAGKMRIYFSVQNILDMFKTFFGTIGAIITLFRIFPDVVFSKGGYVSFPTLVAARILGIPVVIHESDTHPGRVNAWAGKFAKRIAVSYPEAAEFFQKEKTAWTGQPIREEIMTVEREGAFDFLKLDPTIPTLLILGGSQGAEIINNALLDVLPDLVQKYQIIHQVGTANIATYTEETNMVLAESEHKERYVPLAFLNVVTLRAAAGAASLVITRAGSTIFEVAQWGIPSIVIPITTSNGDHQRKNAFAYGRAGGCVVVEESNLTPHVLLAEIDLVLEDKAKYARLATGAKSFAKSDAALVIARELLTIAASHNKKSSS